MILKEQIRKLLNKPEYWENTFASGYHSTTYGADGKLPERTQQLVDKVRPKLGGGEIDVLFWWVAMGYDTVKVIEHAIKTSGSTDPAGIQKVLESTKDFKGVTGPIGFDAKGDIVGGALTLKTIKGGKLEFLKTVAP